MPDAEQSSNRIQEIANQRIPVDNLRERVRSLFSFLKAFHQLDSPVILRTNQNPWFRRLTDLPEHHNISINAPCFDIQDNLDANADTAFLLTVKKTEATECPTPLDSLLPFIGGRWLDPKTNVFLNLPVLDDSETELFANEARSLEFNDWNVKRETWRQAEVPARDAKKFYEELFKLYNDLTKDSESYELIIADGIFALNSEGRIIQHPVLSRRLEISFDPVRATLSLTETDSITEFYSDIFQDAPNCFTQQIKMVSEYARETNVSPVDDEPTEEFLGIAINSLFGGNGRFIDFDNFTGLTDIPTIYRDPHIVLRKRSLGYSRAIEKVLEDIDSEGDISTALGLIVGFDAIPHAVPDVATPVYANEDEDVLFAKPANEQQLAIAKRLAQHKTVLVQGPPGTGKTHTIANLIGHLLAQGKSILVTSHTSKALKVLKNQLPNDLKPLCVSLLDNAEFDRDDLERSVSGIVSKLSTADQEKLTTEGQAFKRQRLDAISQLRKVRSEIAETLRGEDREIVYREKGMAHSIRPIDAAKWLAENQSMHGWISDQISISSDLSLSKDDFLRLYRSNSLIATNDLQDLACELPSCNLWSSEEFTSLISKKIDLQSKPINLGNQFWLEGTGQTSSDEYRSVLERVKVLCNELQTDEPWRIAALEAGIAGATYCEPWVSLVGQIEGMVADSLANREAILTHSPSLSSDLDIDVQKKLFEEMANYLEDRSKISKLYLLVKPTWKKLIESSAVNSQRPSRREHFQALATKARLTISRENLRNRWNAQMVEYGAEWPINGNIPNELVLTQTAQSIRRCVDWSQTNWREALRRMQQCGFQWDALVKSELTSEITSSFVRRVRSVLTEMLPSLFDCRANAKNLEEIDLIIDSKVRAIQATGNLAQIGIKLVQAIQAGDKSEYARLLNGIEQLTFLKPIYRERGIALTRLKQTAPQWAAQIELRMPPHDGTYPPGDIETAWKWKMLRDEIARRHSISLIALQDSYARLKQDVEDLTSSQIERQTWAEQKTRWTYERRTALQAWRQTAEAAKGDGKRANICKAEAQKLLDKCRDSVPVWIMPLSKVVESFDPRTTRFDVVIVDESSQSDIRALIALYLCDEIVVVGDDKQVSPTAVGLRIETITPLIQQYLGSVPFNHMYYGTTSLYDLAEVFFGSNICLIEHFRCVPDIIRFSNELSYLRRIKPLRESSSAKVGPAVVSYYVTDASYERRINIKEAEAVASLLVACNEHTEYDGCSFGVISMIGKEQSDAIDNMLRLRLNANDYQRRNIRCGNASHFQGDERDVMFLSVVHAPKDRLLPIILNSEIYQKRLNVAASRAKDQMWVIHSVLPGEHLQPLDLRTRLIEHAKNPDALRQLQESSIALAESDFEKDVIKRLTLNGFNVVSQWPVGSFRIDIVITDGATKLAVECDGDRYHTNENYDDDMRRQAMLERLGWHFVRIRGSAYYLDPDNEIRRIVKAAEYRGIRRTAYESNNIPATAVNIWDELKVRVLARAQQLRLDWNQPKTENTAEDLPEDYTLPSLLAEVEEYDFEHGDSN